MDLETFRAIDVDIDLANDFVPDVILSANDYNGRCIVARVTNGGVSVSGDNLSARLLFNAAPGISAGGYVTMTRVASSPTATWQVPVPSDALAARQVMLCVQIVDSDDNLVCSRNFRGIVDRKLMDDDAPESVNELNRLWEGIDALENIDANVTADGTVSVTAPDGTVTTSTAVPTAVSAATAATNAANTAAGAANTAATDAAQAVAALQAYVPLDADNILKASDTGAMVSVDDAYPSPLLGLVAYGNSVQDGTPTPETPVPIKSVAGAYAITAGKNLIKVNRRNSTVNRGITSQIDETGLLTVSGTSTGNGDCTVGFTKIQLKAGIAYCLSLDGSVTIEGDSSSFGVYFHNATTNEYIQRNIPKIGPYKTVFTPSDDMILDHVLVRFFTGVTATMSVHLQLEIGSDKTDYEASLVEYTPLTLIDDQGVAHELRSAPNGIRDDLILNADGSGTLVENINRELLSTDSSKWSVVNSGKSDWYIQQSISPRNAKWSTNNTVCNLFPWGPISATSVSNPAQGLSANGTGIRLRWGSESDKDTLINSLDGGYADYVVQQPITYHIPAINMPSLPDLVSNAWLSCTDADGAAIAADIGITYRRDINKVISDLETAIADIVSA